MAGSYGHVVNDDGGLRKSDRVQGMLECVSGDVYEAVEEMYGMIWWLATYIANDSFGDGADPAGYVEAAQENYKEGLVMSPTKRFKEKK